MLFKIWIACFISSTMFLMVELATSKPDLRIWEYGIVPFEIGPSIGCPESKKCDQIKFAIDIFQKYTCLRFKKREGEDDHGILFKNGIGLYEEFGYKTNFDLDLEKSKYEINRPTIYVTGVTEQDTLSLIQSIALAIGLVEENLRPDRDNFIRIRKDRIHSHFTDSFKKLRSQKANLLTVFDELSITLFERTNLLRKNWNKPIFENLQGGNINLPSLNQPLSPLDIEGIHILYDNCKTQKKQT